MNIAEKTLQLKQDFDEVYTAGKKSQYDEFWDAYQIGGARRNYIRAFSYCCFNKDNFKPKYPIVIIEGEFAFAYNATRHSHASSAKNVMTDLIQVCKDNNVVIDTSQATNLSHLFYAGDWVTLPTISFESHNKAIQAALYMNPNLVTIEKVIFKADGSNTFTKNSYDAPFTNCVNLRNIEIEGVIGDDFDIRHSAYLTKASIESIVNALSTTSNGKTVSFSKTAKQSAFTDSEWNALIATKPNWTFSLA